MSMNIRRAGEQKSLVVRLCMTTKPEKQEIEGKFDPRKRPRRWKIGAEIASESGLKERSGLCSSFMRFLFFEPVILEHTQHQTEQGFGLRGEKEGTSFSCCSSSLSQNSWRLSFET